MSKASISFDEVKQELLRGVELKEGYDKLRIRYETIEKQINTIREEVLIGDKY